MQKKPNHLTPVFQLLVIDY